MLRRIRKAASVVLLVTLCFVGRGLSDAGTKTVRKGELEVSETCSSKQKNVPVRIDNIWLVCDSPDADVYYNDEQNEEAGAYTNSITCRAGDRAKLAVDCTYLNGFDLVALVNFKHLADVFSLLFVCVCVYEQSKSLQSGITQLE
jgi:hypothetical protein